MDSMVQSGRIALVAAHPDDETIGAGGCLGLLPAPLLVHVTDGAPRDMRDAAANGFATREDYATARRVELLEALRAGGVMPGEMVALGYVDLEAALHLAELVDDLARLFREHAIQTVLTHAYEGGHPDHDAVAFAVHAACRALPMDRRPRIVEFTSYHGRDGRMETGVFLPNGANSEAIVTLGVEALERKASMVACYRTQQAVLQQFTQTVERFRRGPDYDFSQPPHLGRLYYEQLPFGFTAERWAALAQSASEKLGLC